MSRVRLNSRTGTIARKTTQCGLMLFVNSAAEFEHNLQNTCGGVPGLEFALVHYSEDMASILPIF